MVEVVDDLVRPSEFILPTLDEGSIEISGALWISGGNLYTYNVLSGAHLVGMQG